MKTTTNLLTITLAALLLTASVQAQAPAGALAASAEAKPKIDPAELKSVPNISLAEESAELAKNIGKIVRIRFSYRTSKPAGMDGDKAVVEVMHETTKRGLLKSEGITLVVPMEGAAWMGKLKPTRSVNASEFVYARVVENKKAEALGTKIVNGALAW